MRILCIGLLASLLLPVSLPALASDVADERARIANQRIQVEEARRAAEEAERLSRAANEAAIPDEEDSEPPVAESEDVASAVSAERMEMSRALEQLRELGALRDAGYVTEQEFEQLKRKILDAAL